MLKPLSLITFFVILNMGIGRMFQESLGIVCFSELSILAITSFFFWSLSAKQVKEWSQKWAITTHGRNFFIQGGLGMSATVLNIVLGQLLVIFVMTTVYQCTSPSFDFLNASLTNNVAVNLLCYFALLFYFTDTKSTPQKQPLAKTANRPIKVTKKGAQFVLAAEEVIYVEASNNCIVFHTEKGKFVKYQSLKSLSESLCPTTFKRIHRSCLLNISFVDSFQKNKNGDGTILLKTGEQLKFSRTYFRNILMN